MTPTEILRVVMYCVAIAFFLLLIVGVALLWANLNERLIFTRVSNVLKTTDTELPKFFVRINDTLITTKSTLKSLDATINKVNTETLPRVDSTLTQVNETLPKLQAATSPESRVSTSKSQVKPAPPKLSAPSL